MEKQIANPFEDDIVREPRHIRESIRLNDDILEQLKQQFAKLKEGPFPRTDKKLPHAQFLLSPHAGYGKTHLIGRLFSELDQEAFVIYLRPFEDAVTCWKSVLQQIIRELDAPVLTESEYQQPAKLENFAHRIFTLLTINLIESGKIRFKNREAFADSFCEAVKAKLGYGEKWISRLRVRLNALESKITQKQLLPSVSEEDSIKYLRETGIATFRDNSEWVNWIYSNISLLAADLKQQCRYLNASVLSWLRVLFVYAYQPSEFGLRETCLDWLRGRSVDENDADRIGIRPEDRLSTEVNTLCKSRILDLCRLAGFSGPFVFCFDQTEYYGKEPTIAREFGLVIEALNAEACNQMTVVTVNQAPWRNKIRPHWEDASLDRLSPSPLEARELTRKHAEQLIEQRLDGYAAEKADMFRDDKWLDRVFKDGNLTIRNFLRECNKRWRELEKAEVEKPHFSEVYKKYVEKIRKQPERLVFDEGPLRWLVTEVASEIPHITIEPHENRFFTLRWKLNGWQIFFGFEEGNNWNRWQAIANQANEYHAINNKTRAVFFRTSELAKIPGNWKIADMIEEAKQRYLNIVYLDNSVVAELFAAYDLCINASEGDISFGQNDILRFVYKKFEPWWQRIQQPTLETPLKAEEEGVNFLSGEVKTGFKGFEKIVKLRENEDIYEIDMSSLTWIDANLCAPLGAILYKKLSEGTPINLTYISAKVESIMQKNHFLLQFGWNSVSDEYSTTIQYQKFENIDNVSEAFQEYVSRYFRKKHKGIPNDIPHETLKNFRQSLFEIFKNAFEHSYTKYGIFVCGQFFPRKKTPDIQHCRFGGWNP